jgi:chemotaxis protein MotB
MAKDGKATIVIRREEVVEGGHHGGAWKVAYADFVTAMMAFFLLMWLLNATTEEQRRGIADYFSPHNEMGRVSSGYGAIFGGRTPNSDGSMASDRGAVRALNGPPMPNLMVDDDESGDVTAETPVTRFQVDGVPRGSTADTAAEKPVDQGKGGAKPQRPSQSQEMPAAPTDKDIAAELERRERSTFDRAAQQIRDAIAADPSLSDLSRQLLIDVTPEGLRVQLVDAERQAMFATGSAVPNERARSVLAKITPILLKLPEQISVTGHTDATPYKGADRSNWDLSADRANATRRLLLEAGLPEGRVRSVAGMADRDPLIADDKLDAANRRIAIVVLRDKPVGARP